MLSEAHGVDLNGTRAGPAGVSSLQYTPLCTADSISTSVCLHQDLLTRLLGTADFIRQHKLNAVVWSSQQIT